MKAPTILRAADGSEWQLVYTVNAMIAFEEETGSDLLSVFKDGQIGLKAARSLIWAGLKTHHPGMTMDAAGDVIDACGFQAAMDGVAAAITAAFPAQKQAGKGGRAGNGKAAA